MLVRGAPPRRAAVLAAGGVVLLGVTGIVRASFELLHLSQLWGTSYGVALLVKTAILLAALATGWLLRARIRVRASVELVLVAAIVVAVSVLVLLRPGRNVVAAPSHGTGDAALATAAGAAPGALVLAKEVGPLGVAIALEPRRITAIVLSPAGGGLSGLDVVLDGNAAKTCGTAAIESSAHRGGPSRSRSPASARSARRRSTCRGSRARPTISSIVSNCATARSRASGTTSELRSDPTHGITARWLLEQPNRVDYAIPGGAQGIVIGGRALGPRDAGRRVAGVGRRRRSRNRRPSGTSRRTRT